MTALGAWFDFLLSSGPAIVFALSYKPESRLQQNRFVLPKKVRMMKNGSLAVAIVHRQVIVVKAVRSHTKRDRLLDVSTFAPLGDRLFIASDFPNARIPASDILTIFPFEYTPSASATQQSIALQSSASSETLIEEEIQPSGSFTVEMLELPPGAFAEFQQLCSRNQEQCDKLWISGQPSNLGRKIKSIFPLFR